MAKTISITYEGSEYTLEYTRRSVEQMEKQGFDIREVLNKPMTTLPAMFAGAFLANHRFVKKEVVDAIFESLSNKQEFVQKLSEMYNEPIEALMDDPEDGAGNASWGANW